MLTTKVYSRVLGIGLLSLINPANAIDAVGTTDSIVIGSAYDVNTGDLLYTETHKRPSSSEHTVTYREVNGETFATKKLTYAYSSLVPSFYQVNERNGEVIEVTTSTNNTLTVNFKASESSKLKSKQVGITNRLIVDAGFDHFIHKYWDNLNRGDVLKIDFLAPTRQITAPFRIETTNCKTEDSHSVCFMMSPDAWWISLVMEPIYLVYNNQTKRLSRYLGRGNISEKNGNYLTVDLRYRYQVTE
ncbi:hypothetical protein O1D97_06530 [Marinomonas sp. 15G1-11]|uniref:DUF3108 domain-containing protein n=1 Tax=Marinomonas phaeophyticola TaxID=3004091 RepID=A0ABT4JSJ2_9GAMM|nr:hypothetical protein [Marinomonas sp. 15G1-11]MCZ2721310.1 hypothetical protein [Marinomonas sp. 15G1-11]